MDLPNLTTLLEKATLPFRTPGLWDASGLTDNQVRHTPGPGERWKTYTEVICTLPPDPLNRYNARLLVLAANNFDAVISSLVEVIKEHDDTRGRDKWNSEPERITTAKELLAKIEREAGER